MTNRTKTQFLTSTAIAMVFTNLQISPAYANPEGGTIKSGAAVITTPDTTTLEINQNSQNVIIDWKRFDIKAGETTRFVQPNSEAWALNRVVGSTDPSRILGSLEANGNVIIVNPDGIHFGSESRVDVNRLIATTHDISDNNFMAGKYVFDLPGNPSASIVNEGDISIADYGLSAFVAPSVRNSGTITAKFGQINLASGNQFTIDPYGDGLIKLAIDDEITSKIYDVATGKQVSNLVKNEGVLKADGGIVALSAATARQVVNSVVNNTGIIEANSIGTKNGKIILGAQTSKTKIKTAQRQKVKVSGKINSTAYPIPSRITVPTPNPRRGGRIEIMGEEIEMASALLDVSGVNGGGTVLIGGDYKGGNGDAETIARYRIELENQEYSSATWLSADEQTLIKANALSLGNGGKVILWSDETTNTAADIYARGGSTSGNGGFVETSGKQDLISTGFVNAGAVNGLAGTWLLDPANLSIIGEVADSANTVSTNTIESSLNSGTNISLNADARINIEGAKIHKTNGGNASFTLNAGQRISMDNESNISATSGELDINFISPSILIGGNISVQDERFQERGIFTNGGDINLNSTIYSGTGFPFNYGIKINDLIAETDGGNFTAQSADRLITYGDSTITTATGDITFSSQNIFAFENYGTSGSLTTTLGGIKLHGKNGVTNGDNINNISTNGGAIEITSGKDIVWTDNILDTGGSIHFESGGKSTFGNISLSTQDTNSITLKAQRLVPNGVNIKTGGGDIDILSEDFSTGTFQFGSISSNGGDVLIKRTTSGDIRNLWLGNGSNGGVFTGGGNLSISTSRNLSTGGSTNIDLGGGTATLSGTYVSLCTLCAISNPPNSINYNISEYIDLSSAPINNGAGVSIKNGILKVIIDGVDPTPVTPPTPIDNKPTVGSNTINQITYENGNTGLNQSNISNLFSDDGGTQNLTITFMGVPTGVTATANADGSVSFTSNSGVDLPVGNHSITISAKDNSGQTVSRSISLNVSNPAPVTPPTPIDNKPTVGSNTINQITYENGNTGLNQSNISNLFSDDGGTQNLTITFMGVPTGVTATANADGSVSFTSNSGVDLPVGNHSITISAKDNSGQTVSRSISLIINKNNQTTILLEVKTNENLIENTEPESINNHSLSQVQDTRKLKQTVKDFLFKELPVISANSIETTLQVTKPKLIFDLLFKNIRTTATDVERLSILEEVLKEPNIADEIYDVIKDDLFAELGKEISLELFRTLLISLLSDGISEIMRFQGLHTEAFLFEELLAPIELVLLDAYTLPAGTTPYGLVVANFVIWSENLYKFTALGLQLSKDRLNGNSYNDRLWQIQSLRMRYSNSLLTGELYGVQLNNIQKSAIVDLLSQLRIEEYDLTIASTRFQTIQRWASYWGEVTDPFLSDWHF